MWFSFIYVLLDSVSYGSCRCGRENAKIFVKMDNECWKLLVKKVFSLKEFNIVIKGDGIAGSRSERSILSRDKL